MIYDTYDTQLRLALERYEDEVRRHRLLRAARPARRGSRLRRLIRGAFGA